MDGQRPNTHIHTHAHTAKGSGPMAGHAGLGRVGRVDEEGINRHHVPRDLRVNAAKHLRTQDPRDARASGHKRLHQSEGSD